MSLQALAAFALLGAINTFVASRVNSQVTDAYMDEPFHVPQAQAYCEGRYLHWDPKLTTPPGLYIVSNALLWPLGLLSGWSPLHTWCSMNLLRFTNLMFSPVLFWVLYRLSRTLHRREQPAAHALNALALSLFPVGYFFNFLYYTDTGSVTLVLLSYLFSLSGWHGSSALVAAFSLFFRQTNAVWIAFIAALAIIRRLSEFDKKTGNVQQLVNTPASRTKPIDIAHALAEAIRLVFAHPLAVVRTALPYALVLASFAAFIVWNGGIVLGDKSNHVAVTHIPQLFYFICFAVGFSAPHTLLSWRRLQDTLQSIRRRPVVFTIAVAAMIGLVHRFTYEHPFILSDNRHFTFYLWRRVFRLHPVVKYALTPAYAVAAVHWWRAMARSQSFIWCLGFVVALVLALVPSPLIEFRYFILPFVLYRLHLPLASTRTLAIETGMYLAVNAGTIGLFLLRPFRWASEPNAWQRFMW
ncbi:alpha-2-glucosyltransferase Alg10 [Thamnocephalis sphaerospora]|uniref:Dol-P-Glc:Glc(2)Man(9)GlcNAc(2)-PP-Dol alpha-1,2-glucosyltransferase n=1 Tax=Thamnocephalis sphaerospora TaxID=78915 RepID=A0A4P9XKY2_9FUNG|nr:alpha-2-glucosyltransferase Alg10 [Thamnocephalis sphaerospora]|eukprot:RKP06416.1 alpha-2-glucosyltransferase Alg10 [Thamnocephalis sphaerospora]